MLNKRQRIKSTAPELLAPAGSVECFYAAIEAGADAVYLGLGDFNARLRAKNFTARDLLTLVPYAHSRNVKVYITLNTLIKQNEITPALNVLYQLDQVGIDAVIIADIGLIRLASTHFPNLRLHGSTQAAAHNSCGAAFLESLGVKRVVLARELSIDEIRETTENSPIETEVFIHGALCYSISGMCLASSFIGGASGNRGRCTQVCRRRFVCKGRGDGSSCIDTSCGIDTSLRIDTLHGIDTSRGINTSTCNGYFFSPNDLEALPFINRLAEMGVTSFKIEGRMKGAEYVRTVVKAYRHAIDFPDDISTAEKDLRLDFGRAKTAFFLDGLKGEPIDPSRPSGTGVLVGTITGVDGTTFTVSIQGDGTSGINNTNNADNGGDVMTINKGDRLRIHPKSGFEGISCKVAKCQIAGNDGDNRQITITTSSPIECSVGDDAFLIGKADKSSSYNNNSSINSNDHQNAIPVSLKSTYPKAKQIADSLSPSPSSPSTHKNININTSPLPKPKPTLWFKADELYWLDAISATPCKHLIFDADISELELLLDSPSIIKAWRSRIFIALPPFIEESRLAFWRSVVNRCLSTGIRSFTISNIGHLPLVDGAEAVIADSAIYCLNRFTQRELSTRSIDNFVFSHEDEYLNIRNSVDHISSSIQNPESVSIQKSASTPPSTLTPIPGIFPIYSVPPLFVSRMAPAIDTGITVTDPHDNAFFVTAKNGLYYTLPRTPVCLFAKRKKLTECGIENFLIDVSFHDHIHLHGDGGPADPTGPTGNGPSSPTGSTGGYAIAGELLRGFKEGIRTAGGCLFNFKAGLK